MRQSFSTFTTKEILFEFHLFCDILKPHPVFLCVSLYMDQTRIHPKYNLEIKSSSSSPFQTYMTQRRNVNLPKRWIYAKSLILVFIIVSSCTLYSNHSSHDYMTSSTSSTSLMINQNLNDARNIRLLKGVIFSTDDDVMEENSSGSSKTIKKTRVAEEDEIKCPTEITTDGGGWVNSIPKGLQYTLITVLILFSAFFSGLTLSMMGLDTTGLEIVMSGDDPVLSRAAGKIYPVRKNGNLLLCTLLLGNVAVNTLLGILMADITGGTVGFITSTALIVIFGEIIPQVGSLCI